MSTEDQQIPREDEESRDTVDTSYFGFTSLQYRPRTDVPEDLSRHHRRRRPSSTGTPLSPLSRQFVPYAAQAIPQTLAQQYSSYGRIDIFAPTFNWATLADAGANATYVWHANLLPVTDGDLFIGQQLL
jgi:hypothetical protein